MSLTATPSPGTFTSPQLVTLTDAGSDSIFYTVDGSSPSYVGSYRDWNDGLLTNQTGVSSNGTATFANPGSWLRQAHSAASTQAISFLDFVPQAQDFTASFRFRFNSASCNNDTQVGLTYRCSGKYAANDTYGYFAAVTPVGGVALGRGTNSASGGYTQIGTAPIPSGLAYDTWHTLTVIVSGARHRISVNGVQLFAADDNTYMFSGYVGLRTYAGTGTPAVDFDNFLLESVGGTTQRYTAPIPVVPGTVAATTIKAVSVLKGAALAGPPATPAVGATGKFTDARDGRVYKTVFMPDGKWWAAENLAWDGAGTYYINDSNNAAYGRLYTWSDSAASVPTGTHVPSFAEWGTLVDAVGGYAVAGKVLKSTTLWNTAGGTDAFGFAVLPGGIYVAGGSFANITSYGYYWSTTDGSGGNKQIVQFRDVLDEAQMDFTSTPLSQLSVRFIIDSGNVPDGGGSTVTSFDYTLPVRAQAPTATVSGTSPNAVVTLASATPGATLYYSVDGSTPTGKPLTGKYTDARDGKVYKTVLMPDGKWWAAENLAWAGAGNDVSHDPSKRAVYGRLYQQAAAVSSVPSGTHLPTDAELTSALFGSVSDLFKGTSWDNSVDPYGFTALPAGQTSGFSGDKQFGQAAFFWSSTSGRFTGLYSNTLTTGIERNTSPTDNAFSVRFIIDSGNIPDVVLGTPGTLYTTSFPYRLGQPVTAIARAAGYLDSLPVRLYPVDTVSGIVIGTGYVSTNNTVPYSAYRALWLRQIPYSQNTQTVTELTPWLTSTTYRFYGTILETPAPPTTGTASTKQPVLFPDQGIQISVFPRQPTVYDNRVDWGNGPVTNRSLKVTWRVPQNDQFVFASTKTAVSKLAAFGDLDVVTQSDTWAVGGANATAQLAAPVGSHYLDVNASLGFVSGIAQTSQATRVTGGRNSAPMAIWLSPGAGNARLNIPIHCIIQLTDADLDNINYVVTDGHVTVVSGAALSGQLVFDYVPTLVGPLQLSITLTDPFNFQTVVPAPSLTVLNNQFPVATFTAPASGTSVYIGEKISIQVDLSDAESENITWQLLKNHSQLAYGTTSPDTSLSYKFTVPAGPSQIGIVVADPLGAAPEQFGPMIYGAACKATGITTSGTLQSLNPITLTPTTVGAVDHVVWDMYPSTGSVSLQSATAPFSVVWTPAAFPTDQDVVVTATAYDAAGYGVSFSKTLRIAKADIVGTLNGADAVDTAHMLGGANLVVVTIAGTEAKDVVAITGGGIEPIHIAVAATDAIDVAAVTGTQLPPVTGTLYGIEGIDSGHLSGHVALKVTGSVTGTETADSARVLASNARPVLGNVQATDPVDYALFLSPPPPGPGWNPDIEFIEIADVVDIGVATRILASAFSPYADVTEFVVEYQRITTPDPETDPSPWLLLQYVTPTR